MNRLKHLRLADLELFVTAATLKNLGKAAVLHHLSQSATSACIVRVEDAFGLALCTHEKRHFHLTQEGEILLPKIQEWLKQFYDTVMTDAPRPIRVVTTQAIARVVISPLLSRESIELTLMRPDKAYEALLINVADVALVPDNAVWTDVISTEVGAGVFQLYSSIPEAPRASVLLPENQLEVLNFTQRWEQLYDEPLPVKVRIPSWSLIADICASSQEVGFLPEFLAKSAGLHPVSWQPMPSQYRILALHRPASDAFHERLSQVIACCQDVFSA